MVLKITIMSSNEESISEDISLTPVEDSNPKINIVLTPEERELCNYNLIEVVLYYIAYPSQLFNDLLCKADTYYTYIINKCFNRSTHED